jgi:hypothetical protein
VLDPELRAILFYELFDHRPAPGGLLLVGVEGRNLLERDLFGIVIEIARQQHVPGVGELEKQRLVPGRMTRRGLDDHGAVAKHIMILAVQHNRFAVGEALEKISGPARGPLPVDWPGRGARIGSRSPFCTIQVEPANRLALAT